jgi:dihydroneopterin aldolase
VKSHLCSCWAIEEQISQGAKRKDVARLYHEIIELLRYDYSSTQAVKAALNKLAVPNYSGKTGSWKVDQVRRLMQS